MKQIMTLAALFAGSALLAAPQVGNVSLAQVGDTVTINYTLTGEPGIVTVDVQTNNGNGVWTSIGNQHLTYFGGDANKIVRPDTEPKTITWKPSKAWPDHAVDGNVKAVVNAWATNAPPDYMVVSLVSANSVEFYASAEQVPYGVTDDRYKTDYMLFRKIPAANVRWRMGSPSTEEGRASFAAQEVTHVVTLTEDYYIGVYEVTQRQFERMRNERPSQFTEDYMTRPVENVSYNVIRGYCDWPSGGHTVGQWCFMDQLRTTSGQDGFDLPTDAQWEFACRAGCGAALYSGKELEIVNNVSTNMGELGRYNANGGSTEGTAKVGSYKPNAWGLYDMLGNVYEWCLDYYVADASTVDPATGPTSGTERVIRGGVFGLNSTVSRCAFRSNLNGGWCWSGWHGFRVACPALVR